MLKGICKILEIRESDATTESASSLEVFNFFFFYGRSHV